jgi:hypothetical protein
LILLALLALTGCKQGDDDLEIRGTFVEQSGSLAVTHVISNDAWAQDFGGGSRSTFHILRYGNARKVLVAQNDAANAYNPSLFSRFHWSWQAEGLYYCQQVYDAPTAGDADAGADPDPTAPAQGGCGLPDYDFPWSLLTPAP